MYVADMYLLSQVIMSQLMSSVASQGSKHNLVRHMVSCQQLFHLSNFFKTFLFLQEDRETQRLKFLG